MTLWQFGMYTVKTAYYKEKLKEAFSRTFAGKTQSEWVAVFKGNNQREASGVLKTLTVDFCRSRCLRNACSISG